MKKLTENNIESLFIKLFSQQSDGLSMGSPLAPLLANWFVSQLETNLLNKTKNPKMYCRYVDDIFCIFENKEDALLFEKELNSMHKDMKFTIQTCQDGKLPFLDTLVAIKDNTILTSTYKKPTSTGVLMNYNSCVPQSWKRNLVKNLYYRNKHLVSEVLQNEDWQKVKDILMQNSFPNKFIDEQIQKTNNSNSDNGKNAEDNFHYFTIPYIRKVSEKFSKKIRAIFEDIGVKIRMAYNTQKVGKYFSLKDSVNDMYQSCVVYKFKCPGDLDNQYIGETERQLFVRIKEHATPSNSAVFRHIENCKFCKNCNNIFDCFNIVKKCISYNELLSTEALFIKKLQPNLNNQLGPDKGSRVSINIFK